MQTFIVVILTVVSLKTYPSSSSIQQEDEINMEEFLKQLKRMRRNKAPGIDKITIDMILDVDLANEGPAAPR